MSEVAAFIKQEFVEIVDLAGSGSSDSDDEERHCRKRRSICSSPSSYEEEAHQAKGKMENF